MRRINLCKPTVVLCAAAALAGASAPLSPAHGQSDPSLFTHIINLPDDVAGFTGFVGDDTQVNIFSGNYIGSAMEFGDSNTPEHIEVNVYGGTLPNGFGAYLGTAVNVFGGEINPFGIGPIGAIGAAVNVHGGTFGTGGVFGLDSTLNLTGGTLGNGFIIRGSTANIYGGTIGDSGLSGGELLVESGSTLNLYGGTIDGLESRFDSTINQFGGAIEGFFLTRDGEFNLFGSAFTLDGVAIADLDPGESHVIVQRSGVLAGTLADGSIVAYDLGATDNGGFTAESSLTVNLVRPGDANTDGFVGVADLDLLLANWGDSVTPFDYRSGDFSGDGLVGQADLDLLTANFGTGTPPGGTIPEPGTLALIAIAAGFIRRRP